MLSAYDFSEEKIKLAIHKARNCIKDRIIAEDIIAEIKIFSKFYETLFATLGLNVSHEEIMYYSQYKTMAKELYVVNDDAFKLISERDLKGKNYPEFALFSNTWPSVIKFFEELGVLGLFKYLSLSFISGYKKPDINAFEHLCSQIKCLPSDVCLFDDSPINIKTASTIKMSAYRITFDTLTERMIEVLYGGR